MSRLTTSRVVVALAAVALSTAACTADDRSAAAPRPSVSAAPPERVVIPGRPGESATITDTDNVKAPDGSTYNTIDTAFVQMMIVHHGQAIEMSKLAPERAGDPGLKALAERIGAAQAPEVAFMKSWLQARRLPDDDPNHDHSTMPGMQTPADMTALAGLRGADFDRRFVDMMTAHHRGAMQMSEDVIMGGTDEQLREVAGEISIEQGSEINRMVQLGIK